MIENNQLEMVFPSVHGKKIIADFEGGVVTSDAGLLFLRETERDIGIISRLAGCVTDKRDQRYVDHSMRELITQRVMQISCGYEDADDSDSLRSDPALKIACGRKPLSGDDLGSQPTMSRLENAVSRTTLYRMGAAFVDGFLDSYRTAPKKIIVDVDDTDDPTHGAQQMSLFNAYYDEYCYMPLHIYEGYSGKLICAVLRPGKRPGGEEIAAILSRVLKRIRKRWPKVRIVLRGDSHFSGPAIFDLCHSMRRTHFVLGLSNNRALKPLVEDAVQRVEAAYKLANKKLKVFVEFPYQAKSWSCPQRVICKIEVNEKGRNVRFIVTDMNGRGPQRMYDESYCGRGCMENFIKDHKNALHSDRTSCHRFTANHFRLFLHSAAYVLMHAFAKKGLRGSELAKSQFDTIILKILKIGAQVVEGISRIRIHLPESCPAKELYMRIHRNLVLCAP
jgi:Transposase DDE domain group 1